MRSLRSRLLLRTTSVLLISFVLSALILYQLLSWSLSRQFDSALLLEARGLTTHVERVGGEVQFDPTDAFSSGFASASNRGSFEISTSKGERVASSPDAGEFDWQKPATGPEHPIYAKITKSEARTAGWRGVTFSFVPRVEDEGEHSGENASGEPLIMSFARSTAELDQTLRTIRWILFAVTLATVGGCSGLTGGVIHRELDSLKQLAKSIDALDPQGSTAKVEVGDAPAEIVPVIGMLNELLQRQAKAIEREKSFTADVAHELRTPLAGLETSLEVCLSRERDSQAYREILESSLEISRGMRSLVNQLLSLARADANQLKGDFKPQDLAELMHGVWESFAERATERKLAVEWNLETLGPISIDREMFGLILSNLFENAVTYVDEGGRVRIGLEVTDGCVVVSVANSGASITCEEAARVFDRFWRGDSSRTETGNRCGLGLSLCRKLADVLGATMEAEVREKIFCVRLTLPGMR